MFAVAQDNVVYECSGIARAVFEDVLQAAVLVTADGDCTMVDVDARVVGLDGAVDAAMTCL